MNAVQPRRRGGNVLLQAFSSQFLPLCPRRWKKVFQKEVARMTVFLTIVAVLLFLYGFGAVGYYYTFKNFPL